MYAFFNRALLPHVVFWAVLAAGWYMAELSYRQIGIALGLWIAAITLVPMAPYGGLWMTAIVALMDVVLILKVFKGDIRV